jgi:5-oxoprolinase (ATP-hydrolysing)
MQSNGGLTDAQLFQGATRSCRGRRAASSAWSAPGEDAGFDRLIGFDMGGTSTDVCHYAGTYERSFETEVAGVRMRAPMMHIHTVAAGGGSILSFREGRFQVGPESAGADPGPACYRKGGPLTVTDCNVMLGKLNPAHFPAVFGPNADQPLDADVVRERFERWPAEIGDGRSPPEVAEGFLRIAVENMANAIKKISVQRGYDVTRYALASFGGAGGQHACLVADALGMKRSSSTPSRASCRPTAWASPISAPCGRCSSTRADRLEQAEQRLSELAREARSRGRSQGIDAGQHPGRSPRASALRRLPPGACGALRRSPRRCASASRPRTGALRLRLARPRSRLRHAGGGGHRRNTDAPPPAPPDRGSAAPVDHVHRHLGGAANHPDLRRDDLPRGTRSPAPPSSVRPPAPP